MKKKRARNQPRGEHGGNGLGHRAAKGRALLKRLEDTGDTKKGPIGGPFPEQPGQAPPYRSQCRAALLQALSPHKAARRCSCQQSQRAQGQLGRCSHLRVSSARPSTFPAQRPAAGAPQPAPTPAQPREPPLGLGLSEGCDRNPLPAPRRRLRAALSHPPPSCPSPLLQPHPHSLNTAAPPHRRALPIPSPLQP